MKNLIWKVYIENFNAKRIEQYNVFDHFKFSEEVKVAYKEHKDDFDAFSVSVQRSLMYYFWSKCEWEIILSHWPPRKDAREEKIDVYDQVRLNWDHFCDYVWSRRDEFKRTRPRKK
jgi:hypothetical protein